PRNDQRRGWACDSPTATRPPPPSARAWHPWTRPPYHPTGPCTPAVGRPQRSQQHSRTNRNGHAFLCTVGAARSVLEPDHETLAMPHSLRFYSLSFAFYFAATGVAWAGNVSTQGAVTALTDVNEL